MGKGCVSKALIVLVFAMSLCLSVRYGSSIETYGETVYEMETESEPAVTQIAEEPTYVTDLTEAFDVILNGATKEFIAGYAVDESFLMWLDAQYGDEVILQLAYSVLDHDMNPEIWYKETGNSMHALWLRFCRDSGFQNYQLDNVYWQEAASPDEVVIGFTGDINFAEGWYTTEAMRNRQNGIEDCFSKDLLQTMQASDILIMNNEFVYMEAGRSEAVPGKAYAFRAEPDAVELLDVFGADAVTLANNHVYDYGETGLLDTMRYLAEEGIPYVGAGADIDEASKILYYVANGRKIAIVAASQIERTFQYTREATRTEAGVLKTLNPDRFLRVIEKADANSDYVIVVPHWGTEGTLYPDTSQRMLAERFVQAGADVIIGSHPHRLQGVGYVENVPVVYSLGNFWFSDGTLYTTVAQVVIQTDGEIRVRFLPCEQRDMVTSLLVEQEEKDSFYHYLAAISMRVGIDADGNVYDKGAIEYPAMGIIYDSDISTTDILGVTDNEGNAIDIVGNRK
ncbi:MAG: CapA family protein [Clostridiales bacterium]|nr:CapA family protein [Roseburia sp.]MDD7637037.1 CapA family protein [Clostridiales bacterium]MDY4111201.1 CapA family protein [Roseburia sp.]